MNDVGSNGTYDRIKADPPQIVSPIEMPTSLTKAANTTLGRASKRVSSALRSAFGPYHQTDEHTQATLDTIRGGSRQTM
jgi:hypothetical protein